MQLCNVVCEHENLRYNLCIPRAFVLDTLGFQDNASQRQNSVLKSFW